ncbi:MAG: hypothetical protein NZM26_01330 [Patescibacteria group bacterium]|nr:hypothetical protein [Patescibacteria group bacterium]
MDPNKNQQNTNLISQLSSFALIDEPAVAPDPTVDVSQDGSFSANNIFSNEGLISQPEETAEVVDQPQSYDNQQISVVESSGFSKTNSSDQS